MSCQFCQRYCFDHTREDCPTCGTLFTEEQLTVQAEETCKEREFVELRLAARG